MASFRILWEMSNNINPFDWSHPNKSPWLASPKTNNNSPSTKKTCRKVPSHLPNCHFQHFWLLVWWSVPMNPTGILSSALFFRLSRPGQSRGTVGRSPNAGRPGRHAARFCAWSGRADLDSPNRWTGRAKRVKGDIRTHCCRFVRMLIECLNFYIFCLVIKSQMFFFDVCSDSDISSLCEDLETLQHFVWFVCPSSPKPNQSSTHTQTTLHMDGQNLANPPGLYLNNRNQHITLYLKKTLYE